MERRLFPADRYAYVLIASDNSSPRRVSTLDEAHAAIEAGEVTSAAGILAEGVLGVDVDAEDYVTGDAIAEVIVGWCARRNLAHLIRLSGRPGGRHVVALASKPSDRDAWAALCRKLAQNFGVPVTDRTGQALRLLTAPHRASLDAPVIRCTLQPEMIAIPTRRRPETPPPRARYRRPDRRTWTGVVDRSRSAIEYGDALVHVRRGSTAAAAWKHANRPGTKSQERGYSWWRRHLWLPAVTTVAAEAGLSEDAAWELAQQADPATALKRGRSWWIGLWDRAVDEAAAERPRRRHLSTEDSATTEKRGEIEAVSTGLRTAAAAALSGLDPRSRRSVDALCDVAARHIVTRAGGMATRVLAVDAALDTKTVRKWLAALCTAGVLAKTGSYSNNGGESALSDSYGIGPAAAGFVQQALDRYSPTCCSTPAPRGRANPIKLHQLHTRERSWWALRLRALASLPAGETLKTSKHPLAKLVRSRWVQRHWWAQQSLEQRATRTAARRDRLGDLSASDRSCWFGWLAVRNELASAVDGVLSSSPTADQVERLARLRPLRTFHRGLADPDWRGAVAAHGPLAA
ncbi:hypothetical protein ACFYTF_28865 [Nocardia thailandica]|uniref:Replication protein n=1 Tax=Nocardia thailandica TaxID=257275 RepID=A0ABW6PXH8_9NOCA